MKEHMQNYLFHYNPYQELWFAFKRDNKEKYFNGDLSDKELLKAKDIRTLFDYLTKNKEEL
jgi:hypothetical protein